MYLFVDNLADHIRELRSLAKSIGPDGKQLTIIGTERTNEWNVVVRVIVVAGHAILRTQVPGRTGDRSLAGSLRSIEHSAR